MKSHLYQDMPAAGRVIAGSIGLFLIVGSSLMFLVVRPLNWGVIGLAVAGFCLAVDLLAGALRGKWPVSALVWLDSPFGQ
jgi:hypothetical protein